MQLVTLTHDDIKNRVKSNNSFTKDEMAANRGLIVLERKNRRTELGKMNGSNVGSIIDQLREEKSAAITGMVTRTSAKQQKWVITLTAKRTTTEAERLREKAARLQKQLNATEEALEKADAPAVEATEVVTTKA